MSNEVPKKFFEAFSKNCELLESVCGKLDNESQGFFRSKAIWMSGNSEDVEKSREICRILTLKCKEASVEIEKVVKDSKQ